MIITNVLMNPQKRSSALIPVGVYNRTTIKQMYIFVGILPNVKGDGVEEVRH